MKILLCRSNSIGSWLIRALTWSSWSHVVLINGDDAVEAVLPRVRRSTVADIRAAHSECLVVELPCADPEAAWAAALSQVGQHYDWEALLGFLVHREWASPGKWWCSELVAWSFAQGGSPLFRPEATHRVTPQDLWMLPGLRVV